MATTPPINIGLDTKDLATITDGLSRLLADSYTLHLMFETQYNELALAVDEIAERIRTLGEPAPGSYRAFAALTSITEDDVVPTAEEMIRLLVEANEAVVRTARALLPIAEEAGDAPSADLATQRMQAHEKTAWMLRSMLG
jgi:starvation-inducible DNA-binding protein